jgi:phosphoglycolate phosphatase-like HAD superfamily hydrolase
MRAMSQGYLEAMGWPDALSGISLAGMTDTGIAHMISRQRRNCEMAPEEMEKIFEAYLRCLEAELATCTDYEVLPGIQRFLETQQGKPDLVMGLGTGNLEKGARLKLERGGLNRFFPFGGYGSDSWDRAEVLRTAVRKAEGFCGESFSPERIVVIGDTPHDIRAGRAIGSRTLAVATGPYTPDELRACRPDWVVRNFEEVRNDFFKTVVPQSPESLNP